MPEPTLDASDVHGCSLQGALHHCSTEFRAQNHIDQRMPCLLQDWTCDAGCNVLWTDDEDETELLGRQLSDGVLFFSAGQQNQTSRGLFVMIHSLSFSAPRTVVKSPSDHSSAVPPAVVTLLTTIVCTVPGATRARSSR